MAEKHAAGFEPWALDPWTMDPWTRTMTSAFRFWLSMWPVAPFFGVEWRFAELAGRADPKTGAMTARVSERAGAIGRAPVEAAGAAALTAAGEMTRAVSASVEEAQEVTQAVAASAHEAVAAAEAAAAPQRKAAKSAPAEARADDLTRIKGIGPGLARQLEAQGIHSFAQLAALSEQELAAVDAKLTSIKGRCFRDDWLGQARKLAD